MPIAINLSLANTIDINISDTMLCCAQANLRTAVAAFEAAVLRDAASAPTPAPEASSAAAGMAEGSSLPPIVCTAEPEAMAVPCWVINETGAHLDCWATDDAGVRSETLAVPAGGVALADLWKVDGGTTERDWHEDFPREMSVQPAGDWRPLGGVEVNRPGSTVLALERLDGPPPGMLQVRRGAAGRSCW